MGFVAAIMFAISTAHYAIAWSLMISSNAQSQIQLDSTPGTFMSMHVQSPSLDKRIKHLTTASQILPVINVRRILNLPLLWT